MNAKQRRKKRRVLTALTRVRHKLFKTRSLYARLTIDEEWEVVAIEATLQHIKDEIEKSVMEAFSKQGAKIPYTDEGVEQIEKAIRDGIERTKVFNPLWEDTVTIVPPEPGDKEARVVRSVTFRMPIQPILIKDTLKI